MFLSQHLLPQPPLQHSHHLIFSSHESKLVHSQSHLILKAISVSCHFTTLGWHLVRWPPHATCVVSNWAILVHRKCRRWILRRTFSTAWKHRPLNLAPPLQCRLGTKREPSLEHTHYIYHKWFSVHLKTNADVGAKNTSWSVGTVFASFASIYSKVCRCCELSPASFISCASDAVWNVNVGLFK